MPGASGGRRDYSAGELPNAKTEVGRTTRSESAVGCSQERGNGGSIRPLIGRTPDPASALFLSLYL